MEDKYGKKKQKKQKILIDAKDWIRNEISARCGKILEKSTVQKLCTVLSVILRCGMRYGVIFSVLYRAIHGGLIQSLQKTSFVETKSHTKYHIHSLNKNCIIIITQNLFNRNKFDLT